MILPMVALVLLEVTCKTSASGDGDNAIDYAKLYDTGPGKRAAYSYVSEYKRLPVYNFGLGKRSLADERRLYSFGLGKRSYDSYDDEYDDMIRDEYNKRMKQYSFGLGKRAPKQYSFGLGKRPDGKLYSFGLGKRSPFPYDEYDSATHSLEDDFENNSQVNVDDTVKRAAGGPGGGRLYSFGLGKRGRSQEEPRQGRSMMYNFGLGKRSSDAMATDADSDSSSSNKDSASSSLLVN